LASMARGRWDVGEYSQVAASSRSNNGSKVENSAAPTIDALNPGRIVQWAELER
jgi:hypothetical protein